MPRYKKNHVPTYRFHKNSGQAVVTIDGQDRYLGPFESPESRKKYAALIFEYGARDPAAARSVLAAVSITDALTEGLNVEQVIVAFWQHALTYYRDKEGNSTGEAQNFLYSLRVLRRLFGAMDAAKVDSTTLESCRDAMIRDDLARNTVNRRVGRIRQVFKWAAKKKLVPDSVFVSLSTVEGLKSYRSLARETNDVKAVAEAHAFAAIKHASRHIATMIEVQWLTGMRSGELVIMRTSDIDRTGAVWVYTPSKHKTQHHGHTRIVPLGPRCQALLTPFLKMDPTTYLFSPADAERERRAAAAQSRKTPLSCGNSAGTNRSGEPKRTPGPRYEVRSYNKAVAKACDRAFPVPAEVDSGGAAAWRKSHRFHPHQLRHAAATRFRRDHNLETARALLGQKSMQAAEVYAEMDFSKARDVAAVSG